MHTQNKKHLFILNGGLLAFFAMMITFAMPLLTMAAWTGTCTWSAGVGSNLTVLSGDTCNLTGVGSATGVTVNSGGTLEISVGAVFTSPSLSAPGSGVRTIDNDGTFTVSTAGGLTVDLNSGTDLDNSGSFTLESTTGNTIITVKSGATLTNSGTFDIDSTSGYTNISIQNTGILQNTSTGTFTVDDNDVSGKTEILSGGLLDNDGTFDNFNGQMRVTGTLDHDSTNEFNVGQSSDNLFMAVFDGGDLNTAGSGDFVIWGDLTLYDSATWDNSGDVLLRKRIDLRKQATANGPTLTNTSPGLIKLEAEFPAGYSNNYIQHRHNSIINNGNGAEIRVMDDLSMGDGVGDNPIINNSGKLYVGWDGASSVGTGSSTISIQQDAEINNQATGELVLYPAGGGTTAGRIFMNPSTADPSNTPLLDNYGTLRVGSLAVGSTGACVAQQSTFINRSGASFDADWSITGSSESVYVGCDGLITNESGAVKFESAGDIELKGTAGNLAIINNLDDNFDILEDLKLTSYATFDNDGTVDIAGSTKVYESGGVNTTVINDGTFNTNKLFVGELFGTDGGEYINNGVTNVTFSSGGAEIDSIHINEGSIVNNNTFSYDGRMWIQGTAAEDGIFQNFGVVDGGNDTLYVTNYGLLDLDGGRFTMFNSGCSAGGPSNGSVYVRSTTGTATDAQIDIASGATFSADFIDIGQDGGASNGSIINNGTIDKVDTDGTALDCGLRVWTASNSVFDNNAGASIDLKDGQVLMTSSSTFNNAATASITGDDDSNINIEGDTSVFNQDGNITAGSIQIKGTTIGNGGTLDASDTSTTTLVQGLSVGNQSSDTGGIANFSADASLTSTNLIFIEGYGTINANNLFDTNWLLVTGGNTEGGATINLNNTDPAGYNFGSLTIDGTEPGHISTLTIPLNVTVNLTTPIENAGNYYYASIGGPSSPQGENNLALNGTLNVKNYPGEPATFVVNQSGKLTIGVDGFLDMNDEDGALVVNAAAPGGLIDNSDDSATEGIDAESKCWFNGNVDSNNRIDCVDLIHIQDDGDVHIGLDGEVNVEGSETIVDGFLELDGTWNARDLTVNGPTGHISSGVGTSTNYLLNVEDLTVNTDGRIGSDGVSTKIHPTTDGPGSYGAPGEGRLYSDVYGEIKLDASSTPLYGESGRTAGAPESGGIGGGAVRIYSTGNILINGQISAAATNAVTPGGGGGSGGTIIIEHEPTDPDAYFAGNGFIFATGNGSETDNTALAGSGGRISIISPLLDGTNSSRYDFNTLDIFATSGVVDDGVLAPHYAAAGTIWYGGDRHSPNGNLIINFQNLSSPAETTFISSLIDDDFDRIEVIGGGDFEFEDDAAPTACYETDGTSTFPSILCADFDVPDKPHALFINASEVGSQGADLFLEPGYQTEDGVGEEPATFADITPSMSFIHTNPSDPGAVITQIQIQVDDNPDFSSPIWDYLKADLTKEGGGDIVDSARTEDIIYNEDNTGDNLINGVTYYVRAKFVNAPGLWSHADYNKQWKFVAQLPPAAPPADNRRSGPGGGSSVYIGGGVKPLPWFKPTEPTEKELILSEPATDEPATEEPSSAEAPSAPESPKVPVKKPSVHKAAVEVSDGNPLPPTAINEVSDGNPLPPGGISEVSDGNPLPPTISEVSAPLVGPGDPYGVFSDSTGFGPGSQESVLFKSSTPGCTREDILTEIFDEFNIRQEYQQLNELCNDDWENCMLPFLMHSNFNVTQDQYYPDVYLDGSMPVTQKEKDAIHFATEIGMVHGFYLDKENQSPFKPHWDMSRIEILKILDWATHIHKTWLYKDELLATYKGSFGNATTTAPDINPNNDAGWWFLRYHNAACNAGVIECDAELIPFGPSEVCTVEWKNQIMSDFKKYYNQNESDYFDDDDGDSLINGLERNTYYTLYDNPDSDGDGLDDGVEITIYKSNPAMKDTDFDRIKDGDEVNLYNTDPIKMDTDDDGYSDFVEIDLGSDPLDPNDFPAQDQLETQYGISTEDGSDDYDKDGLSNLLEYNYGTDPTNPDTDGDGLTDAEEILLYNTDPLTPTKLEDLGVQLTNIKNGMILTELRPLLQGFGYKEGLQIELFIRTKFGEELLLGHTLTDENNAWIFTPEFDLRNGEFMLVAKGLDTENGRILESVPVYITLDSSLEVGSPQPERLSNKNITDETLLENLEVIISETEPILVGQSETKQTIYGTWQSILGVSAIVTDIAGGEFRINPPSELPYGEHTVSVYGVREADKAVSKVVSINFNIEENKFIELSNTAKEGKPINVYLYVFIIIVATATILGSVQLIKARKARKAKKSAKEPPAEPKV